MIMTIFRHIKKIQSNFLWISFLILAACGEGVDPQSNTLPTGSDEGAGNGFSVPLPARLQKIVNGTLTAEVVLDGGAPIPLAVEANNVTGQINDLSVGNHTFVINYFVNGVLVATASTTGNITAGATTAIIFAANTIRYPDNDGDGFTNLAEVEIGTDPNNSADRPPAESPRHSTNYILADIIGISPAVGGDGGVASSADYKVASLANAAPDTTPSPSGQSKSTNYTIGP